MIFVQRTPLPPDLDARMREAQLRLNAEYEEMQGSKGLQQRGLATSDLRHVRPALEELFHGKCAYCETPLTSSPGEVENFRPKALVSEARGSREGYWWLTYVWENLLLSCTDCNRLHKVNKFPIAGQPAAPFSMGEALRAERPLLLDPTDDDPSEYLWFEPSGAVTVAPALAESPADTGTAWRILRATTTINVLGLNRRSIVGYRAELHRRIAWETKPLLHETLSMNRVGSLGLILEPAEPHRAAASQWVTEAMLPGWPETQPDELFEELLIRLGAVPQVVRRVVANAARTKKRPRLPVKGTRLPVPPVALTAQATEPAAATPAFVRHVSIRNFKGIKRLDLDVPILETRSALSPPPAQETTNHAADPPVAEPMRTGWYVLLGENGAGKSSVLEAVALALMGKERLEELVASGRIALDKLVYQAPGASPGAKRSSASIRVSLEPAELGEIDLSITAKSFRFEKGGSPVPTLVRGYGYVRLLPRTGEPQPTTESSIRCENLFDPRAPLCDAERWMASLPYDATKKSPFDVAAGTILNLLPNNALASAVPESEAEVAAAHLEPRDGGVVMVLAGRRLSLHQLSAGYQSVIALAADIMAGIPAKRLFDMREACGIVLLDEIGTQLHPSWRIRAIGDLRRAFPRMQFITSTHEPLCLKGVGRDEIVVLKRDAASDEIGQTKSFQDPRTLRVDQLLTSPLFGLDSTIDPDVDRLFQRYFALLARRVDLTDAEQEERLRLERALAPHRGLGYTRSDQLVYALLEQYLAAEGSRTLEDASQIPMEVRRQIFDIWRSVRAYRQTRL